LLNSQEEGDEMTAEDSLAYKQGLADLERAQASANSAAESATGSGKILRWVPLAASAAVLVGGSVMAAVFNSKAKSEREKEPNNPDEYSDHHDKIESAQTMRNVGIGIAVVGAIGVGLSFVF
jgi:hypothetical protein